MTATAVVFALSLVFSLALTPLAILVGRRYGVLAIPQERNIHVAPMPRSGGLALFTAFFLALAAVWLYPEARTAFRVDRQMWHVFAGALLIFGVGFCDDKWTLSPKLKFLAQIAAASIAFSGGVRIESFHLLETVLVRFDIFAYALTVFWFVLFINAINLIDGLDGLAAGVVFFASLLQTVLALMRAEYHTALPFAALCGVTLGFLRYNFNPASIFLGDGGSYFLGYMMAALSVAGSVKSQVGASLLMPIIAFGVPLLDTITAPLRRFVRGRDMFEPDKRHVHHKLLSRGWSQRKTVLFLYGITLFLALTALLLVNLRDAPAGVFLLLVGAALVVLVRKAGYFSYFAMDKIYGWVRDVSDEAGLGRDRRTFLNHQIEISQTADPDAMWVAITMALDMLRFDLAEMALHGALPAACGMPPEPPGPADVAAGDARPTYRWRRPGTEGSDRELLCSRSVMKLELPLMGKEALVHGTLWLVKDLGVDPITDFTLRRVENLRRTVIATLDGFGAGGT